MSDVSASHSQGDILGRIVAFARRLIAAYDEHSMELLLSATARELLASDYACLRFVVSGTDDTVTAGRIGNSGDESGMRVLDQLIASSVLTHKHGIVSANMSDDPRFGSVSAWPAAARAVLAIPIGENGAVSGILIVTRPAAQPYTRDEGYILESIGQVTAPMIARLHRDRDLRVENDRLRESLNRDDGTGSLVGNSAVWEQVRSRIRTIAPAETRVLLLGESGTGKELCARAIHRLSQRREGAFVAVNCAAIADHLAESEFFGHVRGAFTGATRDSVGLFGAANGGTLFLDEIGCTPAPIQSSLLRAIQEGEIRPVGASSNRKIDIRLLCSTSSDLEAMVANGSFRKDLFYRINVVSITLPPLRERPDDIAPLAQSLLLKKCEAHRRSIGRIDPDALTLLELYSWPGNVRELENAIEHAVLFTPDGRDSIGTGALPESIRVSAGFSSTLLPPLYDAGLDAFIEALEAKVIQNTLVQCEGNQSAAARVLKVHEKRIRDRIKKYGLDKTSDDSGN